MADWSELSGDIIGLFFKSLPPYLEEYVNFTCVCKSWRSASLQHRNSIRFGPLLMLAKREYGIPSISTAAIETEETTVDGDSENVSTDDDTEGNTSDGDSEGTITDDETEGTPTPTATGIRTFYSVYSKRFFNLPLPQAQGTRCWGTPYGWLLTLRLDCNVSLLHPFFQTQLSLPSLLTFPKDFYRCKNARSILRFFIDKFALASNPSESAQSPPVMIICGGMDELAFAASGDKAWTLLKTPNEAHDDVIFFSGFFYAITCRGMLKICDINTTAPRTKDFASPPKHFMINKFSYRLYLVDISGELHLVVRHLYSSDRGKYRKDTQTFKVFNLDFDTREWNDVKHLGDYALFLGTNSSFAISTADYPRFKGNCIYYTGDDELALRYRELCDMGVFDYQRKTIEPIYIGYDDDVFSTICRPLFFMPNLL